MTNMERTNERGHCHSSGSGVGVGLRRRDCALTP